MAERHKTYVCRYYHDGAEWTLHIQARDRDDARARVARLGELRLDGELCGVVPWWLAALPGGLALASAWWGLRDWWRGRIQDFRSELM